MKADTKLAFGRFFPFFTYFFFDSGIALLTRVLPSTIILDVIYDVLVSAARTKYVGDKVMLIMTMTFHC